MGKLIKIYDIDEFNDVITIPDESINKTIISNVRNLDEERDIERFIREIIFDPNETPHGPTEIADIFTSHVHVRGEKRLTAFVLKGKSFKKVSSKIVANQFYKLQTIPNLNLIILVATGNIQDDAQRDFIQTAFNTNCDFLIIDAHDLSRLFIAYKMICPKDGTPYNVFGKCRNGHERAKGTPLEMEANEKMRYTVFSKKDKSHAGAKRYSAIILLDKHYTREVIKTIIQGATEKIKASNYYRNENVKKLWEGSPAHVVWLFLSYELEDIQIANWVCRTCWVDPNLSKNMRPSELNYNEEIGEIKIFWNDNYKIQKENYEKYFSTKEKYLESLEPILNDMLSYGRMAIDYFEQYKQENISESTFISKMQKLESKITELYSKSGNIPFPPNELEDYDQACQSVFAIVDNMFLYYSKEGLETWPKRNRDELMQNAIKQYYEVLEKIKFEEKKNSLMFHVYHQKETLKKLTNNHFFL